MGSPRWQSLSWGESWGEDGGRPMEPGKDAPQWGLRLSCETAGVSEEMLRDLAIKALDLHLPGGQNCFPPQTGPGSLSGKALSMLTRLETAFRRILVLDPLATSCWLVPSLERKVWHKLACFSIFPTSLEQFCAGSCIIYPTSHVPMFPNFQDVAICFSHVIFVLVMSSFKGFKIIYPLIYCVMCVCLHEFICS